MKDLAKDLKGKYGIIACDSPIDGLQQVILVPRSKEYPAQQLKYGNTQAGGGRTSFCAPVSSITSWSSSSTGRSSTSTC
ncbi:MAG: hypothetical protein M0D55_14755 [Elusimicrobiota bacterium]|nr:MAG: hypothetical protein M0D55_14755 [Elusimicrobiota bacterium]